MDPSNLFQQRDGLQLQGILSNNSLKHASSGSVFQPFVRNKDSHDTKEPIMVEVRDQIGPESIKDLDCKDAEEAALVVTTQESTLVVPQPHKPLSILPTYPSNLFQPGEGSQFQGIESRKKDEEFAALQHSYRVMEQNYADANRSMEVLEGQLGKANESLRKKEEELTVLQHNFEVMEQNFADANKRIGVFEEQHSDANKSRRKEDEEFAAPRSNFGVMKQNYALANKRIGVLEGELNTADESLKRKEEELAGLGCNLEAVEQKYADANKRIGVLEEQLSTANESLRKKEEELTALRHNLERSNKIVLGASKRIIDLDNLLSTANESLKLEAEKIQGLGEKLKKATEDNTLLRTKNEAFLKANGVLNYVKNDFFEEHVRGLGEQIKKAREELEKEAEDDPMMVAESTHALEKWKLCSRTPS